MSEIPNELKYTSTHEWIREEDDGTITVGITDYKQGLMEEIYRVGLPRLDQLLYQGAECGVVESEKAASEVNSPLTGEVIEVNAAVANEPELINNDPYEEGWLFRLRPTNPDELAELLTAEAYKEFIGE